MKVYASLQQGVVYVYMNEPTVCVLTVHVLMNYDAVRLTVVVADTTMSVGMTTTAVADVMRRSAWEVTRHLPATGTRKKLSHFLLVAVWTNARYRWFVSTPCDMYTVYYNYLKYP